MRTANRPARAAIALLIVAALSALGFIVDWQQRDAPAPVSPGPPVGALPSAADVDATLSSRTRSGPGRVAADDGGDREVERTEGVGEEDGLIRLRSAEGLPLRVVEWRGDESAGWTLVDNARVPRVARSVRALGHVETEVLADAREVTLAADALLGLEVSGVDPSELTEALRGLEVSIWPPRDRGAPERAVLFVDAGGGALSMAATPLRTAPGRRTFEARAIASFVSGAQFYVHWSPRPGERSALRVDLEHGEITATRAPLVLHERGAPEAPELLREVALVRAHATGFAAIKRKWQTEGVRAFLSEGSYVWRQLAQGPPVVPDLPTQGRYVLTLLRADGWYALTMLFHDGEPRDVDLSAPARLTAHVVDADGHDVAGASVRIRFDAVAGLAEDASFWNCAPMTTDAGGRVALVAPTKVFPLDPAFNDAPSLPLVCRVSIEAPFYSPFSMEVALAPGTTRDLGRLVLGARNPDFVVVFPGLVSELYDAAWEIEGSVDSRAIVRVRALGDDTLEVELEAREGAVFPTPERLLLFTSEGAVTALRQNGRYQVSPTRVLRCTLDLSSLTPPHFVQVVARWGALTWSVADTGRADVLEAEHTIDALVPFEGVELSWREMVDQEQYGPAHELPWPALGATLRLVR